MKYSSVQWEAAAVVMPFYQKWIGPEEKCKGPTEPAHFPTAQPPPLDFQHRHAHHYRCQKKLHADYELLADGGGGEG